MTPTKETFSEMKRLQELSIYGELVSIRSHQEMLNDHTRQLVFKDMASEVALCYRSLNTRNKKIVGMLVSALSKTEHQGFNLKMFLYWMAHNESEDKVEQLAIAKHIVAIGDPVLVNRNMEEDYTTGYINNRIRDFQGNKKLTKDAPLFRAICDNLLISPELLLEGCGTIECVKPEILAEYEMHTDFHQEGRSMKRINNNTKKQEYLLTRSVREELEQFAKHLGKTWEDVVDVQYGVINYTYGYMLLKENNKAVVDYLITELHSQQLEHEEELQLAYRGVFEAAAEFGGFKSNV